LFIKWLEGGEQFQDLNLIQIVNKAKSTIEVLTANMIRPELLNHVFFEFYKEHTLESAVKLLLRADQLYNARLQASRILRQAIEIEQMIKPASPLWCVLQ
jgi:hypothetical protein